MNAGPAIRYHKAMTPVASPLDPDHAEFVQSAVSIIAASRNERNETTLSRAVGCRVSPDRRRVTIFLSVSQSSALLADLRANGAIAAVFSRPRRHVAIQLKGADAAVVPLTEEDPHLLAAYRRRMVEEIRPIGFTEAFVRTLLAVTPGDAVAVAFTPSAAFLQTPGPKAGMPLSART
jgi:hypothetical protein